MSQSKSNGKPDKLDEIDRLRLVLHKETLSRLAAQAAAVKAQTKSAHLEATIELRRIQRHYKMGPNDQVDDQTGEIKRVTESKAEEVSV